MLKGESNLVLIGGSTGNGQDPILHTMSPVKLTNRGTLLFRGMVGEGMAAHEGLFLLEGLFGEQTQPPAVQ